MEKDYSKREIDNLVENIHEKLDEILEQTKRTNGRVSKLEDKQAFFRGAIWTLSVIVIPVFLYIVKSFIH